MLNKIIDFSVKNKLIILLFVLALIGTGIYHVGKLPIDAVPDITDNQVQVITTAPSYGALDIERLITFPIEQQCNNISGIKNIRSFSRFGLSLVTLVFQDEVDIYWARQQVAERLQQVQTQIPASIGTPELGPISTGLGEIYQYVIRPKKGYEKQYDPMALRTIQDWIVRRQLLGVPGVAEVSSFGGKLKQVEVRIDPNKLHAMGITMQQVFDAIEQNNQNTGGAYIEKGPTVLYIRSEGLIKSKEDIERIAIHSADSKTTFFIRDVAEVHIGHATRYGALCYNDEGEVAGAIVMMLKGANSNDVIHDVKKRIADIQKTLPAGVLIEPFLDRSKMVRNAIHTVETNLLEGALIVVFILVIFLGNLRAGLVVASVIPLSMLFAIILMNLFGVSGNLMSLGALDFGLIVDGAVIIVERALHQLTHHRQSNLSRENMNTLVSTSAQKMMNSAVFGQIVILVVYLPIFTLQGIEGKMFKPMAQTVAFALLGAFILSLTYIPMMTSLVLSRKKQTGKSLSERWMEKIEKAFSKRLHAILPYRKMVLGIVGLFFILAIVLLSRLGGEFIPALEEGDFAVDTRVLTGSNLNTTIHYTQKAAHILKNRFPEVEKVVTKIGSGEVPTDPMPMEASDMMVILKDKSEWTSAHSFPELEEKMRMALQDVPGITAGFQFPVQMRFNELMTGARQDIVCKLFGENLDTLSFYAEKLHRVMRTIQGAENLYVEPLSGMPQLEISYNRATLAQYKLSINEVNRMVNTAFAGQRAGMLFEDEKRFDIVVKLRDEKKTNVEDIRNMLLSTANGTQIPLSLVADVQVKNGINQIQREAARRRIVVGFNLNDRDVKSAVNEFKRKVEQQIKLPAGYSISYGGAFENLEKATQRLAIAVPIALLLIFILLYFAFQQIAQALLIYSAIPLSAMGGIFSLYLRDMPFSISAGIGFIALFGVAVLNGIVLLSEFNRIKASGVTDVRQIVLQGTSLRLRPVLMTALVASFGFLPMALSQGAGAEVQRPLATVVIGGLLLATLLTLFVLPMLYMILETKRFSFVTKGQHQMVFFVLLFLPCVTQAQQTITLEHATELAIEQNLKTKKEALHVAWSTLTAQAVKQLPSTTILSEYGQINSAFFDTKFAVQQNFYFPAWYKQQQRLGAKEIEFALAQKALSEHELRKVVRELFLRYSYLDHKKNMLLVFDSSYRRLQQKTSLRFEKGESNAVESLYTSNQRSELKRLLQTIETDKHIVSLQLRYLCNTEMKFLLEILPWNIAREVDEENKHPLQQLSLANIAIEKEKRKVEHLKKLPEWTIGYSNSSFRGIGPDNKTYHAGNRFNAVQVGLALPIFQKGIKAKIKAADIAVAIAEHESLIVDAALALQRDSLQLRLVQVEQSITQFDQQELTQGQKLYAIAEQQLIAGEISFLEFLLILQQHLQRKSEFIDLQYSAMLLHNELYFLHSK